MEFMGDARLANRVREIRKANGLTQEDLALRISELTGEDTSVATVSRLESGRMELTQRWMTRIGSAMGVSPHELIATTEGQGLRMLPVVSMAKAVDWMEAVLEPEGEIPALARVGGPRCFAVRPHPDHAGYFLEDAEDGYAVVDPDQAELRDGKVYLIRSAQRAVFKIYQADPPRLLPSCSKYKDDPAHHPIVIGAEPFTVIGRVTYIGREI